MTLAGILPGEMEREREEIRGISQYNKDADQIREQDAAGTFYTILQYIWNDMQKKQRSFRIGMSTIFLVVAFASMFKGIINVAPIAFLRASQNGAGAFDFTLVHGDQQLPPGDVNLYSESPFAFTSSGEGEPGLIDALARQVQDEFFDNEKDHASIMGIDILKFGTLKERLDPLSKGGIFKGFAPRWTLPTLLRNVTDPTRNSSCFLIIVDSAREADLGLIPPFSQEILGDNEMMLSETAMRFLGLTDGRKEKVELLFDVESIIKTYSTEYEETSGKLEAEVQSAIQRLLPTKEELYRLINEQTELAIGPNDTITLDLDEVLRNAMIADPLNEQLSTLNEGIGLGEIPSLDAALGAAANESAALQTPAGQEFAFLLPLLAIEGYEEITFQSTDPDSALNGVSLGDALGVVEGGRLFTIEQLLDFAKAGGANLTVSVPLNIALDYAFSIDTSFDLEIKHNFTVVDSFSASAGKFGGSLGNVALVDCNWAFRIVQSSYLSMFEGAAERQPLLQLFMGDVHRIVRASIESMDFCNYALHVEGVMEGQVETYAQGPETMTKSITEAGNELVEALGLQSNVTYTTPLKAQLGQVQQIISFLNAALLAVIFYLSLLSVQLIYSLMVSDVNEKTYEFGMLRALGFSTNDVMFLIVYQALFFAIPGVVLGLAAGLGLNAAFRHALFTVTWNYTTYNLPREAYALGISIGIIMPLLANILPV